MSVCLFVLSILIRNTNYHFLSEYKLPNFLIKIKQIDFELYGYHIFISSFTKCTLFVQAINVLQTSLIEVQHQDIVCVPKIDYL